MAPSRGSAPLSKAVASSDDVAVAQQSTSALTSAKRNFRYLVNPSTSPNHPTRFRTRALLRTVRYISVFIFWRVVRWAKYIAVGSLAAFAGATIFGPLTAGFAWIAAPPTLISSLVAGSVWGVGKFGARRLHRRWQTHGGEVGEVERERMDDEESGVRRDGTYGQDVGPQVVPW